MADIITGIPFYQEGLYILTKAKEYWDRYTRAQTIAQVAKAQTALGNPNLHLFLRWKYDDEPILERCGETYPVAVYSVPDSQTRFPDSVLLGLGKSCPADLDIEPKDARYRELLGRLGRPLQDRPTFTMKELITEGQLGLKCELGSYFRALDTCDSLEWEILSKATDLTRSDVETYKKFERQLSLRSALHAQVGNPVRNGFRRSAAIAISTLVAYKDGGSIYGSHPLECRWQMM